MGLLFLLLCLQSVLRAQCGADAGSISLTEGADTITSICVDMVADPLEVTLDGAAMGSNSQFVITDDMGNILGLPMGNGPFDLDGAGVGICEIWYLTFEDGLENLATGNNLNDLMGCFDLSNPITVIRQAPDGGMVSLMGGDTLTSACAGNVFVDVMHTTTATELSYWYVITDDSDNILGFANSAETNNLNLSSAPVGVCRIWGWSYRGLGEPVPGDNISSLTDDACEAISNNFITVNRLAPVEAGQISLTDGGDTITSICVDMVADPLEVTLDGTATGTNSQFVITDNVGNILGLPMGNGPFDLDGAGVGICEIWYLTFDDEVENLATGNNLDDLTGCFDLSNPITVIRQAPDGGMVSLVGGDTLTSACAGNVFVDVMHATKATELSYWYVITDDSDNILGFANSAETNTLDLSSAPVGVCRIWGWSYRGLGEPIQGDNISSLTDDACEAISDNFITVNRLAPVEAGQISLTDGGDTITSICVDMVADPLEVTLDGTATGTNSQFVITDDSGNILGLPMGNGPFDLDGAGVGVCEIWYLTFDEAVENLATGGNLDDLTGCFDLSNPITVIRQAPDGGMVSLAGGSTDTITTAGDVVVEVAHTTTATELSYWYIITDENDNILGFANSADTSTLNLSGAPAGTCHIWGWSYRGLADPVMGDNISTLTDDACEAISSNFITVVRQAPAAFAFEDVIISEISADGRIELYNGTDSTIDISGYWLCDFPRYEQVSGLTVECGSMNLPAGEVVVLMGFDLNLDGAELGLFSTNQFGNSEAIVSYLQWGMAGGGRSDVAVAAGIWEAGVVAPTPTTEQTTQTFLQEEALTWRLDAPSLCMPNVRSTSTNLLTLGVEMRVFPNPATDRAVVNITGIEDGPATFHLFNTQGQLVLKHTTRNPNGQTNFDLLALPPGAYTLRLVNRTGFASRRLIIR